MTGVQTCALPISPDDESVNVAGIQGQSGLNCRIESIEKKKEKKNPRIRLEMADSM